MSGRKKTLPLVPLADRDDKIPPLPLAVAPRQVGELLSIGLTQVYEMIKSGELKSFTIGDSRRVSVREILDYIARKEAEVGTYKPSIARKINFGWLEMGESDG